MVSSARDVDLGTEPLDDAGSHETGCGEFAVELPRKHLRLKASSDFVHQLGQVFVARIRLPFAGSGLLPKMIDVE